MNAWVFRQRAASPAAVRGTELSPEDASADSDDSFHAALDRCVDEAFGEGYPVDGVALEVAWRGLSSGWCSTGSNLGRSRSET